MKKLEDLKIKIYADGADKEGMLEMYKKSYIKGFTTNPTLMRKAGVTDYEKFARAALDVIPDLPILVPFFEALDRREFSIVTSTITLLEVLVHPIRQNNQQLVQQYRTILSNVTGIEMFPLDINISEHAAQLRGKYNIRTPDAIQMATAIHAGATCFLTNDVALPEIPNLQMLFVAN